MKWRPRTDIDSGIHNSTALAWGKSKNGIHVEFVDFRNFLNET